MKKSWLAFTVARLFVAFTMLSLVALPLLPKSALAADSLASRGCAPTPYNDNLVYNPSFEGVNGSLGHVYTVYPNSGPVTYWTTTNSQTQVVPSPNSYNTTNPTPNGWPPYDGYNEAVLMSHAISGGLIGGSVFPPHPGLIGTLAINYPNSTPTVVGTKYILSARVSNVSNNFGVVVNGNIVHPSPVAIEMRLRSSATGVESAPVQAIIPNDQYSVGNDGHAWGLISGTVTADHVYDKVVLRHFQDTGFAFIDDVVVCRAQAPMPWWKNHGAQAGLALMTIGLVGYFILRTRHSKPRGKAKASHVAVGDFNSDGKSVAFKVSENESPRPMNRVFRGGNRLRIGLAVIAVAGAAIFIASASGGIWKSQTITPDGTPNVSGKLSKPAKKTSVKAKTPVAVKTCEDKETIKEGYKLYRSSGYKYCILHPLSWPTDSHDATKVTFGTVPDGEPGPGWLKVTYFSAKTVATRAEEIKANFKEPAGPCRESDTTLAGESAKKLDCTGAAGGEDHVYVLLGHGHDVSELSYVEGMGEQKAAFDTQYKVMTESFLFD